MTLVEWIFRSLSVLLALSACWVLAWAMWGDRPPWRPVKTRCPRCWYDLTGVAPREDGWLCVECGHVAATQRDLHRTRRRWWAGAPVLLLASASVLAWAWPTIDRDGWRALVPSWVVVRFWPIDEVAWMEGATTHSPMAIELDWRLSKNDVSPALLKEWSERVGRAYHNGASRSSFPGASFADIDLTPVLLQAIPEEAQQAFHVGDGDRDLTVEWRAEQARRGDTAAIHWSYTPPQWSLLECSDQIRDILTNMISPEQWQDNGGDGAIVHPLGASLLVLAPQDATQEAQELVRAIARVLGRAGHAGSSEAEVAASGDGWSLIVRNVGDIRSHRAGADIWGDSRAQSVRDRIVENIESSTWTENGGNDGTMRCFGQLLLVRHSPEVQRKIDEYLATLRAEQSK